jgi:ribonucleoside-diphosphate reductase alpha chain
VQYHSTINRWHTCPESGDINASNPCSEYMFINDSACNLASLNLMKFRNADGSLDVENFRAAVRLFVIAQEILVDHSSYPNERICRNSHEFRPLGLGYANLGALIMSLGLPYDGDDGRAVAAAVTAIMTGTAYAASAEVSSRLGTFPAFYKSRNSMLKVVRMHREAVEGISTKHCPENLVQQARKSWDEALAAGDHMGFRNAQVTVLAPTGTIGFMMDCDTTGIEPDIALVKYKLLAGGGMFKMVNRTVPLALERLGYAKQQVTEIIEYIDEHDTIEGAPHLKEEHLPVFDCAFKPAKGRRSIQYMGHIRMMAAVQPFLSGAISKTVNMPKEATVEEIMKVYSEGWKLGLKAVAIYRDGSKRTQPLNVRKSSDAQAPSKAAETAAAPAVRQPLRHRLPATRPSITHKFDVAGHEGYLNVGLYEDHSPGELFVTMAKEGSTVGGMMDAFATAISLCLQYGVPLEALVKKFTHQRFEPSGMTSNRDIPFAKSIVDYIFRWLGLQFLEEYRKANLPNRGGETAGAKLVTKAAPEAVKDDVSSELGRAAQAGDKEVRKPGGAYIAGAHGDDGHNGGAKPSADVLSRRMTASAPAPVTAGSTRMDRVERVDQQFSHYQEDAPACDVCGSITVRNGNCYKCFNCGSSLGCS